MAAELRSAAGASSTATGTAIPRFEYNLSDARKSHYGCITAGAQVFHRVSNVDEFFAALGYGGEIRKKGLLHDEFLWNRYRRDGAPKSAQCLQVKIAAYLHKHSEKFKTEFGPAYDKMTGKCISDHIDNRDDDCVDCPLHPRFLY